MSPIFIVLRAAVAGVTMFAPLTSACGAAPYTSSASKQYAQFPGDALRELSADQRRTLAHWLATNPGYDTISFLYCDADGLSYCETALTDTYPYLAVGDFNGDKHLDFAVLVEVKDQKTGPVMLLVFNGPTGGAPKSPAFISYGYSWKYTLRIWRRDGITDRLSIVVPDTDNIDLLRAKGASYEWEQEDPADED